MSERARGVKCKMVENDKNLIKRIYEKAMKILKEEGYSTSKLSSYTDNIININLWKHDGTLYIFYKAKPRDKNVPVFGYKNGKILSCKPPPFTVYYMPEITGWIEHLNSINCARIGLNRN